MEINEEDASIEVISGGMDESDEFSYSYQEDAVRPDYVNGKAEDIEIEYESWRMFEGMWKEILSSTSFEHEVMWKCLQFCYLFPRNYEFHKDDIVQLWMAQGFFPVPSAEEELMENTVRLYFEEFERGHIFRLSGGFDSSTGQLRYRLNHSIVDLLQEQHYDDYLRLGDPNSQISEKIVHSSVPDSSIDSVNFKKMYQAKQLSTLLIFHEPGYRLDQVPRELFLKLPLLRILDLSHTSITELPSSIGKLKDLRYLNLSETPITALPDSLCTLYQLQTLKLRNCLELVGLPDDIRKLKNLRHLDMDPACLLVSMPLGFGDLTQLQSLPAFVVGKENGCHITELRHMVNIGGTLRILRLENVSVSEEAKEAALDVKVYLQNLELQWTELQDGLEVLENLKPHTELGELQIVGYGGAKFPSWIGDPFFSRLVTISIHDCRNCELLPPLGRLPLLCDLCISEMHEVKVIDHQFCGRDMDANFLDIRTLELGMVANNLSNAFPSLEKLTLNGLPKLEKWIRMEEGDFPHLRKLNISGCSKLTTLPKSSLFKSLHQLVISFCPSLESFPQGGLLTSLQYLAIIDCPLLKEQCQNDQEEDCRMLAHVPNVWIDYQQFSPVVASNQTQNMGINSASTPALVQLLEDFGHQAGSSKQITIKNSAIVLPSDPQLEELIHVKDTELQPHLEGKKRLEDPSTETEQLSEGGYNWRSNLKWSNISKVVSRFVPKWKKQSRNNTQPTDVETSSDEDTEYGGATTGSPVKQIVELRLEQLYDSLANQSYKLSSFHAKFGKMMKKLDVMRSFLKQNSTDEEDPLVKMISAQIREFVYEADDIVLDCGIRADYEELFPLRHYIPLGKGFRLRIERMLRDLTKRAEAIEMETNHMPKNLTSLTGNKGTGSRIASRVSHGRSHSKANGLVKNILTGDVQKIKRWIFTNERSRQMAMIGMGGTIARTIYKDNDVRCYFDKLIWVRVSREYSVTDILRSFLIQLGMGNSVKSHDDDVDVMSHIKKSLYNKKYLIVMDDVWNMDYDWWRMLLEHLPAECNRSIIITTTNEEIARKMGVTYFHTFQNLDENESWSLFSEVVFSANKKGSVDSVFQTVGKDIVKKCQGISLAIKAVAGLLATKTESSSQWEEVNNNFRDKLNDESIVHTTLQLSYDDLPAMLKHCILCFSIYPQGTVIDAEQLIYWWVGEGLVHGDHRKTAIEVAFQCLSQLVSRYLVEVDHYRGHDGRIYKCRIDDMVQDFIIGRSIEEGFSSSARGWRGLHGSCRHLGYTSNVDEVILENNPKLLALLSMEDVSPSKLETGPDRIKSLRVLDLSLGRLRVDVVDLLRFIKSQKRLAYLNLKGVANLTQVPDWIKKRRNLKILVINNCYHLKTLPPSITTLHNLLVLDVTGCYRLKLPPGFGGLTKLQVLHGFSVSNELNNLAELRELKNLAELRELTIYLDIHDEIGDGEEYFLSQLSKLKVLSIDNVGGTIVNRLKPPPSLKELNLESCGTTTPHWLTPTSLPKLVYLNIELGGVEGFNPSFWEGNGEGWRIEGLRFNYLSRFELDWEVVKSNMKYLRYAEVRWCPGLKSFPLDANNSGVWDKEEESESRLQSREKTADYGKGKKTAKYAKGKKTAKYAKENRGPVLKTAKYAKENRGPVL